MENQRINWEDVYQSLHLETVKASGNWMLIATSIAGILIIAVFFLFFRKNLIVVAFMVIGVLIFSGKYAIGLLRLSKNPKVYTGVVIAKTEDTHTENSTGTEYITHRIKLSISADSELTQNGLGKIKQQDHKKLKVSCSTEIFNELTEGDYLTVVIMPHDKSIAWYHITDRNNTL